MRDPAAGSAEGDGTVFYDDTSRQWTWPADLPRHSMGNRRSDYPREPTWRRYTSRADAPPGGATISDSGVMTGSRILVVDDEPGILRAVERVLGDIHHVCGTSSSKDAVALAAEFLPALAIVDIRMPEVDGFELMARLKTRLPQVDVILMTGSVDDLDEKLIRAIKSPAFYFIQKPFDREVLKTLVERCLELQWRREAHRVHLQHLEDELSQARAFQQSLLPPREATFNGLSVCSQYLPYSGIGGDLYDYAAADAGQTALLVADVSGHGLGAAMMTSVVKSAFHAARVDGYDPLTVVHRVWGALAAFGPEKFVT